MFNGSAESDRRLKGGGSVLIARDSHVTTPARWLACDCGRPDATIAYCGHVYRGNTQQYGAPDHMAQGGGSGMCTAVHSSLPYGLPACGHEVGLSSPRALKLGLRQQGRHAQCLRIYRTHGDLMFAAPRGVRRGYAGSDP